MFVCVQATINFLQQILLYRLRTAYNECLTHIHPLTSSKDLLCTTTTSDISLLFDKDIAEMLIANSAGVSPSMGGEQWIEGEGKSGVCACGYRRSNCDAITTNYICVSV